MNIEESVVETRLLSRVIKLGLELTLYDRIFYYKTRSLTLEHKYHGITIDVIDGLPIKIEERIDR